MKAPPPSDQLKRLQDLHDLNIMDTEPEKAFDDVVRLAARICETPVALISLVAEDRQWFKARVGMEAEGTPIEQSICAHAIASDGFLEIGDTRTDPRTADNPLVTGPDNLRFYAGALMRNAAGRALGTLCVIDHKPRQLTDLQRETLQVLADQIVAQLDLRRALAEAELLRREVDHRVKNSLQSVAALARVQSRYAQSEETREALDLTRRRIDTVALLHHQLYHSDRDGFVALDDFTRRVGQLLQQSAPNGIRIETEVSPMQIPSARAAAVGVILNEFAANAYKHAFAEGDSGIVRFTIARDGEHHAQLVCADTGRGMSPDPARPSGLGLRIIEASAQQLGGSAETTSGPEGTKTVIRMSLTD
ncbi:sensor histidine kinase [Pseudooceanicola sp. C21-150M6]|uniref:sensor histidine kinase n=1 Tax=Pseudooceanicola sp. C21-150M6 TaxID=3434355 RepID=UPI003D7F3131